MSPPIDVQTSKEPEGDSAHPPLPTRDGSLRYLAVRRRVVDVPNPKGLGLAAVGTGHLRHIQAPADGAQAAQRDAKALVELGVPFELTRKAIDDVERGATDSDWAPVKEAAFAEDRLCSMGTPQRAFKAFARAAAIRRCAAFQH